MVTRLKKVYSVLSQITSKAIADYGPVSTWQIESTSGEGAKSFANKYMLPYLQVAKNCELNTEGTCAFNYRHMNHNDYRSYGDSYTRFILNDGTLIAMDVASNSSSTKYLRIYVDINGQKKPNTFGKDIFRFDYYIKFDELSPGVVKPVLYWYTREELVSTEGQMCNRNAVSRAGDACATLIMRDGWTIADDYPW